MAQRWGKPPVYDRCRNMAVPYYTISRLTGVLRGLMSEGLDAGTDVDSEEFNARGPPIGAL